MKKIAIFIFLNFSIYYSNILSAQSQSVFVGGLFPTIDHSGTIVKNLDYSLYYFIALPLVNFENPDITRDANFLLLYLEHALTYKVNKFLSFSGSYVYQRENVIQSNFLNEHRFHIQATVKHPIKSITLKHRLRFDNRFVADRITRPVPYTHRLRYLIGLEVPIKNNKDNLYFTAYEEAFFNTFKGASAIYAENWAYAAMGMKLDKINKIELGLLYITWNTGGNNWFHQFYFQVTWISYLDFTKKNKLKNE